VPVKQVSPRRCVAAALAVAAAVAATTAAATPATARAALPAAPTYSVGVGTITQQNFIDDTPNSAYIDKDGTFYSQSSHSLYGATDPRAWDFFTGTNYDDATADSTLDNAVNPANPQDGNADTTWRCNNSPTGLTATPETADTAYAERNYCDLVGVWVDPDTGDWYGLVHNEFTPEPFGAYSFSHYDAIDYAVSRNQGRTWSILGHAITSPYSTERNDDTAFPNQTFDYGDGDPRLFVDTASGYFYVFYGTRIVGKAADQGGWDGLEHVARAPISGKMATGTWQKWYDGKWSQPGVGGLESNLVPVTSSTDTGYTPPAKDYNPDDAGTVTQQIAAGTLPAKSPLFIMDVSYDAYLGLYIGEPEVQNTGTPEPQQYYATKSLATEKWTLLGDTGGYTSDSWYRWMTDPATATLGGVVGKTFRAYCSIACSGTSDGEYANITIDSSSPAAPPVDTADAYRISSGDGRVLAQTHGGGAVTSEPAATRNALEDWVFTADGDGSFRITDAATGDALGVNSNAKSGRAWGATPTATPLASAGPSVGQQWWIIPDDGRPGAFRLVNRYSGLVLALSANAHATAETTPVRSWTDPSTANVGAGRTPAEQTLCFTAVGPAPSGR
jgi:hypothetical protein